LGSNFVTERLPLLWRGIEGEVRQQFINIFTYSIQIVGRFCSFTMTNDFFMEKAKRIFSILSNKYLVALIVFAVIMLFTDHNNVFEQMDRKRELRDLQAKKAYYQQEIEKTKKQLADLSSNSAALEKYAREKFLMKRDNEDVFIIDGSNVSKK